MRLLGLAQRNLREILRDIQYPVILLAFPAVMILFFGQILPAGAAAMTPPGGKPPEFLSLEHATAGMGIFGVLWLMTLAAGKIVADKETGFLRRLRTTPTRAVEFVLGYSLAPVLVSLFQIAFVLGVAVLLGLRWQENTYLLAVVFFLCALSSIGLAMLLSAFASNREQVEGWTLLILFPLAFLSGAMLPVEMLPDWLGVIGSNSFAGQAVRVGKQILTENAGLDTILPQLWTLGIWAGSLFLLGVISFRWIIRAER